MPSVASTGRNGSGRPSTACPSPSPATPISLELLRQQITVPLLCDALDSAGLRNQSPRLPLGPLSGSQRLLIGRARTTLWADMAHQDPKPYELELAAIDSVQPDEVLICAAGGSMRSGIWGELLSSAATVRGCSGVIVDGAVRDLAQMRAMDFTVFARGASPYDSRDRQRVIDLNVAVEVGDVSISPGDIVAADADGIVVVPQRVEAQVLKAAWEKSLAENEVRDAVQKGMSATEAFERFGVL